MGNYEAYLAYKTSGVEWLGEIPSHWEVKRLKNIATYNDESLPETTDPDFELEYVEISNVDLVDGITSSESITFEKAPSRARRKVRDGDTIISTVRTYLKAIAAVRNPPANMIVSTGFAVIRPKENLHPNYVGYLLQCEGFIGNVVAYSTGVSYPAINASLLAALPAIDPPLPEQEAIARFLDNKTAQIDGLIAKKEALLARLADKRTALISQAVTKGLDPRVPMRDSGVEWLGEIPEHWKASPLKYQLLPKSGAIKTGPFGSQLLASEMNDSDVKVYNQRTVLDRDFELGENYISEEKYQQLKSFEVFAGDFLVTTRGTIGRCAIMPQGAERGILHPCLMRLQLNPNTLTNSYLRYLVQDAEIVIEQLLLKSNATTIEVIYSETMKSVLLPIPPLSEQEDIAHFLDKQTEIYYHQTAKIQAAIDKLKEYRTALITGAVTGKIDVRGVA